MSELVDFLLARIAEDEEAANTAHRESIRGHAGPGFVRSRVAWAAQAGGVRGHALIERFTPARVLAQCEATRKIIADYEALNADYRVTHDPQTEARRFQALVSIGQLATAYSDHPDYDESWRP